MISNAFSCLMGTLAVLLVEKRANARLSTDNLSDFVEFQTFELDGEIEDMMWCGSNDETILVKTGDGSIYRSRDRGSNWKRLKSLMNKQGAQVADDSQDVSKLLVLPGGL